MMEPPIFSATIDNPKKDRAEQVIAGFLGRRPAESETFGDLFGDELPPVAAAIAHEIGWPLTITPATTVGEVYAPLMAANY